MKELPTDPQQLQSRIFAAFCADIHDIAAGRAQSCNRTNALRQVMIERDRAKNGER